MSECSKSRGVKMILNLTQHTATQEQKAQLVVEPRMCKDKIRELLTFEEIPSKEEIEARASELAESQHLRQIITRVRQTIESGSPA
jgi:hypothetical protein